METPRNQAKARLFDGETAQEHRVILNALHRDQIYVQISGDTLDTPLEWPVKDLRALRDQSDGSRLVLSYRRDTDDEAPRDPARLIVTDPDWLAWLHVTHDDLFTRDLHKGTWRKVITRSAMAVAAVVLMLFVILPRMADTLADILPIERETAFGKSVTAQMERFLGGKTIGALHCSNEKGQAALERMMARLSQGADLQYDINITVFDHEMLNAFAAPGGQIVLMRGLLEQAGSADAVAAVLAHEIGHVESRDATRGALRSAGSAGLLSLVLGDFSGGTAVLLIAEHAFQASYTREAESAADVFAIEMLNKAQVSSDGMAQFFDLIGGEGGLELPEYFSTHPASDGRAVRARRNSDDQDVTRPVLSESDWQDLLTICD